MYKVLSFQIENVWQGMVIRLYYINAELEIKLTVTEDLKTIFELIL